VSLYTSLSWLGLLDAVGKGGLMIANGLFAAFQALGGASRGEPNNQESQARIDPPREKIKPKRIEPTVKRKSQAPEIKDAKEPRGPLRFHRATTSTKTLLPNEGELPPLDLLNSVAPKIKGYSDAALEEMSQMVESILADFGVEVEVTEVHPGPVITRFEI